jgi:TrpR family transcriptional regulator, trp operon repressor
MKRNNGHIIELYNLFSAIETRSEAKSILEDILTPQELESLAERWQEIQMLAAGMTQRDVAKKLGISITKVTRGSRMLQYGSGGFLHFLHKLKKPVDKRYASKR